MKPTRAVIGLPALFVLAAFGLGAQEPAESHKLTVTVGKSTVIDSPVEIRRVSVGAFELIEAVAVSPKEILINAKGPGETSLITWDQNGRRERYDISVQPNSVRLEAAREQIERELSGQDITLRQQGETVYLRGTAKDLVSAERAASVAATLGKVVNLLKVKVPPVEAQVLLKVRFANVDRAAARDLGANIISTGALNTVGSLTTGQFTPPVVKASDAEASFTVSDALNIFLFRRDLNLGATLRALQSQRLLEILAEPNVLAINGKPASFVSGGEFPFPTLQGGGAGLGAVTIQFREFGVRINFLPNVTPRGTIRLQVTPEVSSLDFANGLVFQGFNIPALATRRVQTEVELESGQSFAIAGLLDNRTTESLVKVPGLSSIPLLGKLFQSQSVNKSNSELLVLITPELVRPIPAGQPLPDLERPKPFMKDAHMTVPRQPGIEKTGPVPVSPAQDSVPFEQLMQNKKQEQPQPATGVPAIQFVPMAVPQAPMQTEAAPSQQTAALPSAAQGGKAQ